MAVTSDQLTITDARAVALNVAGDARRVQLHLKNTGDEPAYLGGVRVREDNGFELAAGDVCRIELPPGEVLYAVSTAAGTSLSVLRS